MKKQTTRLSLGERAHAIVAQVAKTKHGKDFDTMFNALHSREFCSWPLIEVQSVAKKVNDRGYKRYHTAEHIQLKDGKKIHVSNQFTFEGFNNFVKHVKKLK